jgi:hypothetical protein
LTAAITRVNAEWNIPTVPRLYPIRSTAILLVLLWQPLLFRRRRIRATREDAFADVFGTLAALYESAAGMKPEWQENWRTRRELRLPPKYEFGNSLATEGAQDMRFATHLLQRYRWKSVVMPLFDTFDSDAWQRFCDTASSISMTLVYLADTHVDLLFDDERDWIMSAVEQFDDATRRRARADGSATPLSRVIAEGTYLPVYIGIQLSDRLLERMRYEAGKLE